MSIIALLGNAMIIASFFMTAELRVTNNLIYQEMTKRLSTRAPVQAKRRVGFIAAPKVPTLEERSSPRETFMLKPMISPKTRRTSLDPKSRSEVKAGKKVLWPLIVFLICWTPYSLAVLVNAVCASCMNATTFHFLLWLFQLRSAISPWLLSANHVIFRAAFIRIFSKICCCCRDFFRRQPRRTKWEALTMEILRSLTLRRPSN
nr:hypothetical protein BaRGS_004590 [Batillaria attramentaria]